MSNLVVAVIAVASFLWVVTSLLQGSLVPQMALAGSWKEARASTHSTALTELSTVDVQVQSGGAQVRLAARNTGNTSLHDFSKWDVIATYRDSATSTNFRVQRLTYVAGTSPGNNQWAVGGIYRDAILETIELFSPDILDPSEEIVIKALMNPASATSTIGKLVVAADNGASLSAQFTH